MVKEPRPGRVKTRLGRVIGMTRAAWWFRHQTSQLVRTLQDPRWQIVLAVSPDREGMLSRVWQMGVPRMPQGPGDLGKRMARALSTQPSGSVCLIGADIPGIRSQNIARAFRALGSADAVFGPSPDGGFWLIGLKSPRPARSRLFRDVRWSSEHALADTVASIPDLKVAYVDELQDVDTVRDLRMTSDGVRAT